MAVPGGNAHAMRSRYTSINTNPAVSGPTKTQQLLATTSITLQEEHLEFCGVKILKQQAV